MTLALNHMVAPHQPWRAFLDLARATGAAAVELRGDLDRPLFDGEGGAAVRAASRDLRILTLAELPRFDSWNADTAARAAALIAEAVACGAEGVTLIPRNDGVGRRLEERVPNLHRALRALAPMLAEAGLRGFIEPLGFETASQRDKAEIVEAIEALGLQDRFALIHDTFHHALAGGGPVHARHTAIVHASAVTDPMPAISEMVDGDRHLPGPGDRLNSAAQLRALAAAGWDGPVSLEPFAPAVHALADPAPAIRTSFEYVTAACSQMQEAE